MVNQIVFLNFSDIRSFDSFWRNGQLLRGQNHGLGPYIRNQVYMKNLLDVSNPISW